MGRHGGIGRHEGLKIPCPVMGVPVRPRLAVPHCSSSIKGAAFFVCSRKNLVPYFFPSMSTWIEICECAGTRGLGLNLAGVNKMNDNSLSTCICRKHHVRLWTTRVRVCDGNTMRVRWACDASFLGPPKISDFWGEQRPWSPADLVERYRLCDSSAECECKGSTKFWIIWG